MLALLPHVCWFYWRNIWYIKTQLWHEIVDICRYGKKMQMLAVTNLYSRTIFNSSTSTCWCSLLLPLEGIYPNMNS